ncbi:hypothetical protein RBB77_09800 [Tunturibacter psychrotolerans]|uniref:Glycosyl hydrolase family 13 catalytic domain-containing protein n=1 Tax=Tunturiibacter psychrotolerans TaxID=3069686 RepID=A0AAU7ZW57_9BACT
MVESGKVPASEYLSNNALTSRDNSRTPMQWDTTHNAGFTQAKKPWIVLNPNYLRVNVHAESDDKDSVLAYYQQLIRIRRSKRVLIFGAYRDISGPQPNIYAYVRSDDTGQIVVALNFSDDAIDLKLPLHIVVKHRLISNVTGAELAPTGTLHLLPWQATMFA